MSVVEDDVIVKLDPAVRAETRTQPGVPPSVLDVTKILVLAVTNASLTVAVPDPLRATEP